MTVPAERTLAVLRTRGFLMDLADPEAMPRIPLRLRQQALSLLKRLPTGADLSKSAQALPDTFGPVSEAMFEAGRSPEFDRDVSVDDLGPSREEK
jgi:hypothetical protein